MYATGSAFRVGMFNASVFIERTALLLAISRIGIGLCRLGRSAQFCRYETHTVLLLIVVKAYEHECTNTNVGK